MLYINAKLSSQVFKMLYVIQILIRNAIRIMDGYNNTIKINMNH
jgi:hypothetical protein